MATKKYRIETDKGAYIVEVDDGQPAPQAPPQKSAMLEGIRSAASSGQSEEDYLKHRESMQSDGLRGAMESAAMPRSAADLLPLVLPTGAPSAARAIPEAFGDAAAGVGRPISAVGRGLEAIGTSPAAEHMGTGGAIYEGIRGNPGRAALSFVAPRAVTEIGQGLQRIGNVLTGMRSAEPEVATAPWRQMAQTSMGHGAAESAIEAPPIRVPGGPGDYRNLATATETPTVGSTQAGHVVGHPPPFEPTQRPYAPGPTPSFGTPGASPVEPSTLNQSANFAKQSMGATAAKGGAPVTPTVRQPLVIGGHVIKPSDPLYQALLDQLQSTELPNSWKPFAK
jgi:hypothetical protein